MLNMSRYNGSYLSFSVKLLLNASFRWIYIMFCCYYIVCSNANASRTNRAYSEADDLINDLDRPSKFITSALCYFTGTGTETESYATFLYYI